MIERKRLLALFERMEREHWAYELGAAKEGLVDCSGAFVWAFKQLGASIEHGSNSIYHVRVGEVVPVAQAKAGYAVFKMRAWRDEDRSNRWYGTVPGDCYHIGLMGADGKILNAQSVKTGFVASNAAGWSFAAPLKQVDYTDEEKGDAAMFGNATVTTAGGALNLREGASTRAKVLAKLENGTRVNVTRDVMEGWVFGKTESGEAGYLAAEYLVMDENTAEKPEDAELPDVTANTTTFRRDDGVYITLAGKWALAED